MTLNQDGVPDYLSSNTPLPAQFDPPCGVTVGVPSVFEGGEFGILPEVEIVLERVKHGGGILYVFFEKENDKKRLHGIVFPRSKDSGPPSEYELAAFDYLHNVIGLSLRLAHAVLAECKEQSNFVHVKAQPT